LRFRDVSDNKETRYASREKPDEVAADRVSVSCLLTIETIGDGKGFKYLALTGANRSNVETGNSEAASGWIIRSKVDQRVGRASDISRFIGWRDSSSSASTLCANHVVCIHATKYFIRLPPLFLIAQRSFVLLGFSLFSAGGFITRRARRVFLSPALYQSASAADNLLVVT